MKNKYKNFQVVIKFWCFIKWNDCDVTCLEYSTVNSADVITKVEEKIIGFVFSFDKEADFLKQQILNCQKLYDKVYLITDNVAMADKILLKDNTLGLLNISNAYGFGNVIREIDNFKLE